MRTIVSCFVAWSALLSLISCSTVRHTSLEDQREALRLIDLGTMNLRNGDLDEADASFKVASELASLPAAIDGRGCVAFLRGEVSLAESYFLKAYQMDPSYTESLANLAMMYESRGYEKEAAVLYRRAISEDPRNFRARNNFAAFLLEYGANDVPGSSTSKNSSEIDEESILNQLLAAKALAGHPVVEENILKMRGGNDG